VSSAAVATSEKKKKVRGGCAAFVKGLCWLCVKGLCWVCVDAPLLQKKKKKEKTDVAADADAELPPLKIGGK
jgi:hypothetical protein